MPAAALMLGAAQAGTTIGLNVQTWTYADGGAGYQTTGFPVTARAFGVDAARWISPAPFYAYSAVSSNVVIGSITANLEAKNPWQSGIGELNFDPDPTKGDWVPQAVTPGNDEVTWGILDNTGWSVGLSGLTATFPNGYVILNIAALKVTANSRVAITDGVTFTNSLGFNPIYTAGTAISSGPVGLQVTPTLNYNAITMSSPDRAVSGTLNCALAGFVITDQPVVSRDPANQSVNQGSSLNLTAGAIGVGTLSYQWRLGGVAIAGATDATYTVPSVTAANAGNYDLVVTNLYGATTSAVATVSVIAVPSLTVNLAGTSGTLYAGANFSQWSVVAAGGLPLHYTWYKNGTTPVGTDSPTLTLLNLTATDSGYYSVTVTNSYGSVKSATNNLTVVPAPNLYTTDVAMDGPGAYWPLGETTGTNANDYSGLGHPGAIYNGVTLGAVGPRPPAQQGFNAGKTAYQFDGASSYIDCGTGASLGGGTDFTIEAWINTSASTAGRVIQQRYVNGYNGEYFLGVNANGTVNFVLFGGGDYQFNLTSPNTVNDGAWHHLAATRRNGTNGVLYIDGNPVATQVNATIAPLDKTFITYIGADMRDKGNYFNGSISDVAIYPFALSNSRIGIHAYHGLLGNSPIVLSQVPGGYVADTKPTGVLHPGENRGVNWQASVADGTRTRTGVASFTGNSQVVIPANVDFDSAKGTICFWLQATAPIPGPGSSAAMLFDRRTTNGPVIVLNDAGAIAWQGPGGARNEFSGGYVPDSLWHHIAVTYGQAIDDPIEIYIDGVLSASTVVTNGWSWPVTQQIELGKSHDSYWKRLNGQMDDFRIYNRVLTSTEINSIINSDALVDNSALKVRYNFDTAGVGTSLVWSAGALQSSPTLGPSAVWTPVTGALSPFPFLPPPPVIPTGTTLFYRVSF